MRNILQLSEMHVLKNNFSHLGQNFTFSTTVCSFLGQGHIISHNSTNSQQMFNFHTFLAYFKVKDSKLWLSSVNLSLAVEGDGELHPAGTHQYTFVVPLPVTLPSSFEGEHGMVRYCCKATIDKPWKFDHETKTAFTVLSHLDLNREPDVLRVGGIYCQPIFFLFLFYDERSFIQCCLEYSEVSMYRPPPFWKKTARFPKRRSSRSYIDMEVGIGGRWG